MKNQFCLSAESLRQLYVDINAHAWSLDGGYNTCREKLERFIGTLALNAAAAWAVKLAKEKELALLSICDHLGDLLFNLDSPWHDGEWLSDVEEDDEFEPDCDPDLPIAELVPGDTEPCKEFLRRALHLFGLVDGVLQQENFPRLDERNRAFYTFSVREGWYFLLSTARPGGE